MGKKSAAKAGKKGEAKPAAKEKAKPAAKEKAKPAAKQTTKPAAKQTAKAAAKGGTSDSTLAGLNTIISKEAQRKAKKEQKEKLTLLPLKRVNSVPVVYQTIPMSKYLYSDSRSVDFGFIGNVDIPNQFIYMDEVPDKPLDTSPLKVPELDYSKPYESSSIVDVSEKKALKALKTHDMMHFLKKRVGEDNLKKIHETSKSPYEDLRETGYGTGGILGFCGGCLLITLLLLIICVGALVGLTYAGIRIPVVSDLLVPPSPTVANATNDGNITGSQTVGSDGNTAGSYAFGNGGDAAGSYAAGSDGNTAGSHAVGNGGDGTASHAAGNDGNTAGSYAIGGPGISSGQSTLDQTQISRIDAMMTKMYGEPVDISFKFVTPPEDEMSSVVRKLVLDVYKYFGFDVERVTVDKIEPLEWKVWRLVVRTFGRVKSNQDLMMWYGFNENSYKGFGVSPFWKNLDSHFKEIFLSKFNTSMVMYVSGFDISFMEEARRYYGKLKARRPPAHIPEEWGDCGTACP